jgi:hypothetical protein
MLMNPVDAVVEEIHRLLRANGFLAAIISAPSDPKGFQSLFRKELLDFVKEKYPDFRTMASGDEKFASQDFNAIFPSDKFRNLNVKDISFKLSCPPDGVWVHFKDMYLVTILPLAEQELFRRHFSQVAEEISSSSGQVNLDFSMKLITCNKGG